MDTDGDGVLSEAELDRISDRFWARLDADGDDRITPEEMRERRHRRHHRH